MADQSTLETLEHDPLAAAFAQLRSEVRHELVAPGPNAARRTLRHRRTRRVALCAAAVVLAIAGYVGLSSLPHTRAVPPADPAATFRAQALQAIGWSADPGVPWVLSASLPAFLSHDFGTATLPYPRGSFDVSVACVGGGRITMTWYAPGDGQTASLPCGGRAVSSSFTFQTDGVLTLSVTADSAAAGHAAIAVEVSDPAAAFAAEMTGQAPYADLSRGSDVFRDANPSALENQANPYDVPAGRYRLIVACDGDGIVAATLTVGAVSSTTEVRCSRPEPTVDFATVTLDKPATSYAVRLDPRAVTLGTALAYRVVKA